MSGSRPTIRVPRDRLLLGHEGPDLAGPGDPDERGLPFLYPRDALTTHAVILGRTGSGKTGLAAVLCEELALSRVPVIVVDPKGDMTNLALAFPGLRPEDMGPWVDPARNARDEATRWRDGLEASGQSLERVRIYRDAALTTVYLPGWVRGGDVPRVDVLPCLRPPRAATPAMRVEQARGLVTALLGAMNLGVDPGEARHVFLAEVVEALWSRGQTASLDAIVAAVDQPPFASVGPMPVDRFLPPGEREKLARALVGFTRASDRWLGGTPLDPAALLAPSVGGGPARTSVFTISHLEPSERLFFLTLLLDGLCSWLGEQAGTSQLRAVLLIEEARGLLPPHPANPPTKGPLARLLAQARAFGLGVVVSTQHPVDLDYKALSNVGTWFLGGLRERDLQRDLEGELRDRGVDAALLSRLDKRTFLACTPGAPPRALRARWALSYLRGPIAPTDLPALARLAAPPPGAAPGGARDAGGSPSAPVTDPWRQPARVDASPAAGPGERDAGAAPGGAATAGGLARGAGAPATSPSGEADPWRRPARLAGAAPVSGVEAREPRGPGARGPAGLEGREGPDRGATAPGAAPPGASARRVDAPGARRYVDRTALGVDPWAGVTTPLRKTTLSPPAVAKHLPCRHGPSPVAPGRRTWRASLALELRLTFAQARRLDALDLRVLLAWPLVDPQGDGLDWERAALLDPERFTAGTPSGWHEFEDVAPRLADARLLARWREQAQAWAEARLGWAPAPPPDAARRRLDQALAALLGARPVDLPRDALAWLLGPGCPLLVGADGPAWSPPADAHARLDRLLATLADAADAPPLELAAPAHATAGELGLLWTS